MRRDRFLALFLAVAAAGCQRASAVARDAGLDGGLTSFVAVEPSAEIVSVNWFGVHGSAADNVVLVGDRGRIARWNGSRLSVEESGTKEDLRGVYVVSVGSAWAVGANGTVLRWLAGGWTVQATGTQAYFNAVWADGAQMIAVGAKGAAFAFDRGLHSVPTDSPDDLLALAADKMGPFAVGTLGTIARYDGKAFHRSALPGYSKTLTGAASGKGGTWLVGVGGAVFRTDGMVTQIADVPPVYLRGVALAGASVWVVGFDSLVARVVRGTAQAFGDVPDRWYQAVWAASDEDVWIVGNHGVVLRSNAAAWPDGGVRSDGGVEGGAG